MTNILSLENFFEITALSESTGLFQIRVRIKEQSEWRRGFKIVCCSTKRSVQLYSAIVVLNDSQIEYFFDKCLPNGIYDFHLVNMKDEKMKDICSLEHFVVGKEVQVRIEIDEENDVLMGISEPSEMNDVYGIFEIEQNESKEKYLIGMKQFENVGENVLERYINVDKKMFKKGNKYEVRIFKSNYKIKWNWLNIFGDEAYVVSGISNAFEL